MTKADRQHALAQFNAAVRALSRQDLQSAERFLLSAIALDPQLAEAYGNLGALLRDTGRPTQAEPALERAVQLKPNLAPACVTLALLKIDQRRWMEATVLLRRALSSNPSDAEARYWLGTALMGTGDAAAAREAYAMAVKRSPNHVQARWGLVVAQLPPIPGSDAEQQGAPVAFAAELRKLIDWFGANRLADGAAAVGVVQPFYVAYVEQNHRDVLSHYGRLCADLMGRWAQRAGLASPNASGAKKFRLGIVSAHIHSHSVWNAIVRGWVEHLDRGRFELHIFHTGSGQDAETQWAARHVAKFHQGVGAWQAWAKVIADSCLDALVYPEIGMDTTTLRLAALRLAKVQLASWGHPVTTGLPTIDAYISAQAFEPPGAAEHYTEKLIPLPRLGCCYQPFRTKPGRPDFAAWGIQPQDRVLLCAGQPFKYAPAHDRVWIDIARRCQPCKLVFFRPMTESLAALFEQRLRASFAAADLDFDSNVCFLPWQDRATFFALLDRTDVYLDTMGFSGFNTAMQAVERGTPIVAFEGQFMRGRFASAIVRAMGLDRFVANSPEDFVQLVQQLATDETLRQWYKKEVRERRRPLFDDQDTVRALAEQLLAMKR